jgi:hypothetical protein
MAVTLGGGGSRSSTVYRADVEAGNGDVLYFRRPTNRDTSHLRKSRRAGPAHRANRLGTTLRGSSCWTEGPGARLYVVSDRWLTDHPGQEPCQPVDEHGATARGRTKGCRVDQKDEKDSTLLVDRKSSQRIYRLISRKRLVLKLQPNRTLRNLRLPEH